MGDLIRPTGVKLDEYVHESRHVRHNIVLLACILVGRDQLHHDDGRLICRALVAYRHGTGW